MKMKPCVQETLPPNTAFYTNTRLSDCIIRNGAAREDVVGEIISADSPQNAQKILGPAAGLHENFVYVFGPDTFLPKSLLEDEERFNQVYNFISRHYRTTVYCIAVNDDTGKLYINTQITSRSQVNKWLGEKAKQFTLTKAYCFATTNDVIWSGDIATDYRINSFNRYGENSQLAVSYTQMPAYGVNEADVERITEEDSVAGLRAVSAYYSGERTIKYHGTPAMFLSRDQLIPAKALFSSSYIALLKRYKRLGAYYKKYKHPTISKGRSGPAFLIFTFYDTEKWCHAIHDIAEVGCYGNEEVLVFGETQDILKGVEQYRANPGAACYDSCVGMTVTDMQLPPVSPDHEVRDAAIAKIEESVLIPSSDDVFAYNDGESSYVTIRFEDMKLEHPSFNGLHRIGVRFTLDAVPNVLMFEAVNSAHVRAVVNKLLREGCTDIKIYCATSPFKVEKCDIFLNACDWNVSVPAEELNCVLSYIRDRWFHTTSGIHSNLTDRVFNAAFLMAASYDMQSSKYMSLPFTPTYTAAEDGIYCREFAPPVVEYASPSTILEGEKLFKSYPLSLRCFIYETCKATSMMFSEQFDGAEVIPVVTSTYGTSFAEQYVQNTRYAYDALYRYCKLMYGIGSGAVIPKEKFSALSENSALAIANLLQSDADYE